MVHVFKTIHMTATQWNLPNPAVITLNPIRNLKHIYKLYSKFSYSPSNKLTRHLPSIIYYFLGLFNLKYLDMILTRRVRKNHVQPCSKTTQSETTRIYVSPLLREDFGTVL